MLKQWILVFALIGSANPVSAELLTFTSLPTLAEGLVPHTGFHNANLGGGTGGIVKGWGNLSPDFTSTYDPVTGDFDLHLNIYSSSGNAATNNPNQAVGQAHGTSNNLVGSDFGQFDGNVVGTIDWTFDFFVTLLFFEDPSITDITMQFVDYNYATTNDGFVANSWDGTNLTLWGVDGTYLGPDVDGGGRFDVNTTTIGFDFVGVTEPSVIPEPSSFWILLMGMICLGTYWKRCVSKMI